MGVFWIAEKRGIRTLRLGHTVFFGCCVPVGLCIFDKIFFALHRVLYGDSVVRAQDPVPAFAYLVERVRIADFLFGFSHSSELSQFRLLSFLCSRVVLLS